jgi:hypothetical protein
MTDITRAAQDDRLVSFLIFVPRSLLTRCRVAVVFAIQSWLAETPEQKKTSTTPAYFQVGMSSMYRHCLTLDHQTNQDPVMSLLVVSLAPGPDSGWSFVLTRYYRVTRPCSFRPRLSDLAKHLERKRSLLLRRRRLPCKKFKCSWYSGSHCTV